MEIITSSNKYTIKQIFKDHWDKYLEKNLTTISPHVVDEVEKMIACRDPLKSGYHKYVCPDHPSEITIVPHSCKSRFCSVCGVSQTNKWMNEATSFFPNCSYFHVVLTIPDTLWYFFNFESKKPLLDLLFKSANETVLGWFCNNRKVIPGAIFILHTFGKKLNYNTHIHMIITAGGLRQVKGKFIWKKVEKLPWDVFAKRWKAIVLKNLNKHLGNLTLYSDITKKRWYTHSSINPIDNPEFTCKYIGRYSKRPPMAETRITNYDGDFVTFYYDERKDNYGKIKTRKYITVLAENFIALLTQHIMPKQFKMVRHYGLFSNKVKNKLLPTAFRLLNQKIKKIKKYLSWRERQFLYLKYDPLICKICGKQMILKEIVFWSKTFDELYIKHMDMKISYQEKPRGYCALLAVFHTFFKILCLKNKIK